MKYFKAVAINKTRTGDEWLSTICQARPHLGKDFLENVILNSFGDMCYHGIDCTDIEIRVGTSEHEYGDRMDEILTIFLHTVVSGDGSEIYADVGYLYNDVFSFIRRMTIGK